MLDGPRTPAYATPAAHRRVVLAVTCAVHLLALFLWTQEQRILPARPPQAVTILLHTDRDLAARPPPDADMPLLPVPSMPAVPSIPAPPIELEPVRRPDDDERSATGRATERDSRADTARVTAPPVPDAAPSTPNPIDTAQAPDPTTDARALARTQAGAASVQGGFVAGLARHQAGRVERELRKGRPGVPVEADTTMARFQRGLESAHIDRALTLQSDTYTSPDGVVFYRFRQGNRFHCRRAGGVGMPLAGMPGTGSITAVGAGAAGATDCPKGVVWNQDP